MSELKSFIVHYNGKFIRAYEESEADKVIAELKRQIEFLKVTTDSCKNCGQCADGMGKVFDKEFNPLKDKLRREKYKRCLAMAMWCEEAYNRECGLNPEEMTNKEFYKQQTEFWPRWNSKWIKIAEKFKEAK